MDHGLREISQKVTKGAKVDSRLCAYRLRRSGGRKHLLTFLTFVNFCAVSLSQEGKIEVVGPAAIDFGKYPAWEKKVAQYTIKNSGKADLKIIKVRKTCGCASASCNKTGLKPGETGVVEVVVLPNSIFKLYSKNTFVESSDPSNRFLKLNVAGNAIPLVDITPKANLYAGRIKSQTAWSQSFAVKGSSSLQLGKPQVVSNYDMDINLKKGESGQYNLSVSLKPTDKSGDLKCSIKIPVEKPLLKINGVETNHQPISLSVVARIGYELSVVPGIARISLSDQPTTKRFSFRVLGQRSRILKPEEMKLPGRDDVEFEVKQNRGGRYLQVKATFSSEFSKMLYTEETVTLEFSVLGASSATIVCKIKK